jgi:hypothetical protein
MEEYESIKYEESLSRLTMALRVSEGMFCNLISMAVAVSSAIAVAVLEEEAAMDGVGAAVAASGSEKRRAAAMVDAAAATAALYSTDVFEEHSNVRLSSLLPLILLL